MPSARLVLVGFCPAHHQSATEEFFVVQFLHGTFGFLDGLHLYKCETFRTLVVPVTYHFGILHVPYTGKQFEQVALCGVEGQIADVQSRRGDLDPFRFSRGSRRLRTIAGLCRRFLFLAAVSKEFGNPLPECLFLCLLCYFPPSRPFVVSPAPAPTARSA